jgi:Rrf2 family protein
MSLYGCRRRIRPALLAIPRRPAGGVAAEQSGPCRVSGCLPAYIAKLFTQLEKAGLVSASEGVSGGYSLARPASAITVLDVADALEGGKPLFPVSRDSRQVCFCSGQDQTKPSKRSVCAIHAVMLEGGTAHAEALAETSLADHRR